MKKTLLFLCLLSGMAFALTDTDADGVSDEKDLCPRVYARSVSGCPTLTASSMPVITNSCILDQLSQGKIIANISPLCDKNSTTCPSISKVLGYQSCDPIFPIIFDKNRNPMIRGSVFIVDFNR